MREIPAGHRIWIEHYHDPGELLVAKALRFNRSQPHPQGIQTPVRVITEARLLNESGFTVVVAYALCGNLDQFNKKRGRDIATGRCLKAYYDSIDE